MALRFSELPWYVQTGLYFVVAVALFAAGEFLEYSPVKTSLEERDQLERQYQQLVVEVSRLQAVKQQHQDFLTRLQALEDQLARARTFVPEEKQTDEFMRLLQSSSAGSQVSVRRLVSQAVVIKEFYAEMPFKVEMDGAYYDALEFFKRLGGTTRIINASALSLQGLDTSRGRYEYSPGTTVGGSCVVTTYYTPSEAEMAAAAPPAPAGRRPATPQAAR
jgi:type IV pilus assembly protein PilO